MTTALDGFFSGGNALMREVAGISATYAQYPSMHAGTATTSVTRTVVIQKNYTETREQDGRVYEANMADISVDADATNGVASPQPDTDVITISGVAYVVRRVSGPYGGQYTLSCERDAIDSTGQGIYRSGAFRGAASQVLL